MTTSAGEMTDLLKRLRYHGEHCLDRDGEQSQTMLEAADMIERLRASPHSGAVEGWKLVPTEPPEEMWGGLARDIIMWTRMYTGPGEPTGRHLHEHLRSLGRPAPNWLLQEINDADRVPSKGTVAVCIYKAMLEAAALPPPEAAGARRETIARTMAEYARAMADPIYGTTWNLSGADQQRALLNAADAILALSPEPSALLPHSQASEVVEALRPFAKAAEMYAWPCYTQDEYQFASGNRLTVGDLRRAQAALSRSQAPQEMPLCRAEK